MIFASGQIFSINYYNLRSAWKLSRRPCHAFNSPVREKRSGWKLSRHPCHALNSPVCVTSGAGGNYPAAPAILSTLDPARLYWPHSNPPLIIHLAPLRANSLPSRDLDVGPLAPQPHSNVPEALEIIS